MSVEKNKQVIRQIYEAMEKGDRSVFGASVHPDYVWRFPGQYSWSRRFEGQEAIRRDLLGPLFTLLADDFSHKLINMIAEGDTVIAEVHGNGATKKGEAYNNEYCFIFRFRNGKIVEVVEYCDSDLIERVLGNYDQVLADYRAAKA